MIKSSTLAGVATLALAALPVLALATNAQAASPAPVTVKVSDIDTLTPEGARIYDARVNKAAMTFCRKAYPNARLAQRADCKSGVRAEMADKFQAHNSMVAARVAGVKVAAN